MLLREPRKRCQGGKEGVRFCAWGREERASGPGGEERERITAATHLPEVVALASAGAPRPRHRIELRQSMTLSACCVRAGDADGFVMRTILQRWLRRAEQALHVAAWSGSTRTQDETIKRTH